MLKPLRMLLDWVQVVYGLVGELTQPWSRVDWAYWLFDELLVVFWWSVLAKIMKKKGELYYVESRVVS